MRSLFFFQVYNCQKFFVGAPKRWDDSLFGRQFNCRPIGLAR